MPTAGGAFKLPVSSIWLQTIKKRGRHTIDLFKQRGFGSRIAEAIWVNFLFPPLAGPLSSHPTWIPNWVPLQVALQMPSIKRLGTGSARARINWFTTLAQAEAQGNQVWAKFRAGTNPGYGVGGRIVVQLKMVPGYYEPIALNRD